MSTKRDSWDGRRCPITGEFCTYFGCRYLCDRVTSTAIPLAHCPDCGRELLPEEFCDCPQSRL